jgi:hypothetical protein
MEAAAGLAGRWDVFIGAGCRVRALPESAAGAGLQPIHRYAARAP